MSKRNLYSTLYPQESDEQVKFMMNFISLCDGDNSLLDIAEQLGVRIWDLYDILDKLLSEDLIQVNELNTT